MSGEIEKLLAVLDQWKQGDYTLDFQISFYFADVSLPVTDASKAASPDSGAHQLLSCDCPGVMMLTQTCDVIKPPEQLPLVEVCALVQVDQASLDDVKKWGKPLLVFIPALEGERMVADLSRVMTIEKGALLHWSRRDGFTTEAQRKRLAQALERKVSRFAFPDTLNPWVTNLKRRLRKYIDKNSPEGECIRAIDQVRLQAHPNWGTGKKVIDFIFLLETGTTEELRVRVIHYAESLVNEIQETDEYKVGDIHVKHFSEISAADYLISEKLDVVLLS